MDAMRRAIPLLASAGALAAALVVASALAPQAAGLGSTLAVAAAQEPVTGGSGGAGPESDRTPADVSSRTRAASERARAARFKLMVRRRVPRWGKQYLRDIAWCESRNNPRAVGGGGAYRGLYQFSMRTWRVVGGEGDPLVASRWEQTWRAWLLLSRHGSGHWPNCA
jgi:soluble lytic murein transglycosylase-like protein